MTVLLVIVILVFLIVIHEFGHFIAAKLFGVRVDEFGVGYPPRALLFGKWGGTEYTLNWIPFGGFVRLYGEDEDVQHGKGSFAESKRWKQAIILVAGVTMNAIAAWALFSGALMLGVPQIVDQLEPGQQAHLVVSDVVPGSPADAAHIAGGDEVLDVTDAQGDHPVALTPSALVAFVSGHGGDELTVVLMRAGATTSVAVTPAHAVVAQDAGRPALGVGLVLVSRVALPPLQALKQGLTVTTVNAFAVVSSGLWTIIYGAAHGSANLHDVVGPVGLVSTVGEAARNGWGDVLTLAGFISVNLAIVNLLPIPALDGGRLFVLLGETIARRRAPRLLIEILNTIGIALIILLMVTVTYHDIVRLFA